MTSILASCFSPALPPGIILSTPPDKMTVEDRWKAALRDQEHLKEALRMKQSTEDDLQRDVTFYTIKNQELTDVLNALQSKTNGDQLQVMRAKAEQNAELAMQVRALKDLLNKSTESMDTMQKDLQSVKDEKNSLTKEQMSHQKAISQIKGLYNTVDKMEVSSLNMLQSEWISSRWKNVTSAEKMDANKTVQCISRKIIAIESDRQRLLQESQAFQEGRTKQEERISALEQQVKQLQGEKKEMRDENYALHRELDVRAGKIGALEELFQTINSTRTMDVPENVEYESDEEKQEAVSVMEEDAHGKDDANSNKEEEPDDQDAESEDIISLAASTVGAAFASFMDTCSMDMMSLSPSQSHEAAINDENPSFHTKDIEVELHQAAMLEVEEWKHKHESLQKEHNLALLKIANLSVQVQNLETVGANSKQKANLREGLLRDVIQQYRELEHEQAAANIQIGKLKEKVARLAVKQYKQEKQGSLTKTSDNKKGDDSNYNNFLDDRLPTFETETSGLTMDDDLVRPQDDTSSTSPSADVDEERFILDDYKQLECECDRLQHEFEKAITKIADLEQELDKSQLEVQASRKRSADQAHAVVLLEKEKSQLQRELLEEKQKAEEWVASKHGQEKEDLRMAELRAEQAVSKQRERECDLWDVIEQYKELADRNAEQQVHMSDVERELQLTHRVQIQRRDLVYEYRRLERALDGAMDTVSQLEDDLKQAKSEAARSKEESKSIRKRLAGCHFHYKQLQEQYNSTLRLKDDLKRHVQKAHKYDALRQEQAESWKAQVDDLRECHRISEAQVVRLTKENQDLLKYCEDALELAKGADVTAA